MSFIRSQAKKSDIEIYTQGSCHDFACAVHAHTGWPLLIAYDKGIKDIKNDKGEVLHALMHVACIDPSGYVWEVTGRVHKRDAARHFRKYMTFKRVGFDTLETPKELERYIGFGDYQVLAHQYDSTAAWADRDARRILRNFEILPQPDVFLDWRADVDGRDFHDRYSQGVGSLRLAIGIATHFGYSVSTAFSDDGELVLAWAEDHDGRPITAAGLIEGYDELHAPGAISVLKWETPHHAVADQRIRSLIGTESLNETSMREAFADARRAFGSIHEHIYGQGRELTTGAIAATIRTIIEEVEYDGPDDDTYLRGIVETGVPNQKAQHALAGKISRLVSA